MRQHQPARIKKQCNILAHIFALHSGEFTQHGNNCLPATPHSRQMQGGGAITDMAVTEEKRDKLPVIKALSFICKC